MWLKCKGSVFPHPEIPLYPAVPLLEGRNEELIDGFTSTVRGSRTTPLFGTLKSWLTRDKLPFFTWVGYQRAIIQTQPCPPHVWRQERGLGNILGGHVCDPDV